MLLKTVACVGGSYKSMSFLKILIRRIHAIIVAPNKGSKRMYLALIFQWWIFWVAIMVKVIAGEIILKLYVFSLFHSAKKSKW